MKRARPLLLWLGLIALLGLFVGLSFRMIVTGNVAVGDPLPRVALAGLDGRRSSLDDWRGKGLILRFSTTSCAACEDDFLLLDALQDRLGEAVQVIAVQVGDDPASVRTALRGRSVATPILLDPSGGAARTFGMKAAPTYYFVTSRGTLSSVVQAEFSRVDFQRHVGLLMAGGPGFEQEVKRVSEMIRCQECEGRSIWESDSPSSFQQRERVRELLLTGLRGDEVIDRLETEYGTWILMAPPVRGYASLAWILPAVAFAGGLGVWIAIVRRARRLGGPGDDDPGSEGAPGEEAAELARRVKEYM